MLAACGQGWLPPPEHGDTIVLGQLDRFEADDKDVEWGVISIDNAPYSVNFRSNEEFNSETTIPGALLAFALDGDYAYHIRPVVFA